jgi:hypothetical protein
MRTAAQRQELPAVFGTEPTVMFNNVPIPISTIAGLAEVIED